MEAFRSGLERAALAFATSTPNVANNIRCNGNRAPLDRGESSTK